MNIGKQFPNLNEKLDQVSFIFILHEELTFLPGSAPTPGPAQGISI
jgi:hypothetical protein